MISELQRKLNLTHLRQVLFYDSEFEEYIRLENLKQLPSNNKAKLLIKHTTSHVNVYLNSLESIPMQVIVDENDRIEEVRQNIAQHLLGNPGVKFEMRKWDNNQKKLIQIADCQFKMKFKKLYRKEDEIFIHYTSQQDSQPTLVEEQAI